jgi:hypothetical protein
VALQAQRLCVKSDALALQAQRLSEKRDVRMPLFARFLESRG